jgi:hypothetical protein
VNSFVATVKAKTWIIRALIAPVVFFNLQCSYEFLVHAERYAPSFDLYDLTGTYMIQGFGLLFLMQAIGAVGETLLFFNVPPEYQNLHASVIRFIYFDAGALVPLLIAWLVRKKVK